VSCGQGRIRDINLDLPYVFAGTTSDRQGQSRFRARRARALEVINGRLVTTLTTLWHSDKSFGDVQDFQAGATRKVRPLLLLVRFRACRGGWTH
jgi:hypothetical protein